MFQAAIDETLQSADLFFDLFEKLKQIGRANPVFSQFNWKAQVIESVREMHQRSKSRLAPLARALPVHGRTPVVLLRGAGGAIALRKLRSVAYDGGRELSRWSRAQISTSRL